MLVSNSVRNLLEQQSLMTTGSAGPSGGTQNRQDPELNPEPEFDPDPEPNPQSELNPILNQTSK